MLNSLGTPYEIIPIFSKSSINIAFSFNDEYSKFFSVTLQSLICNSDSNKNYDIVVFSSDIKERSMKMLLRMIPQNFSLRFYSLTDFIQESFRDIKFEEKDYWSVEMYYRIFIPIIMHKYEKVLYLDSDTLINNNIDELFSISFDNKKLLAVCDTTSPELYLDKNRSRCEHIKNVLGLKDETKYFNSGMLLFNISLIDVKEYSKDILRVLHIDKLLYPDQDMLNVLFEKSVKFISSKWNYGSNVLVCNRNYLREIPEQAKQEFLESRKNPKIIHFISPKKPWNSIGEEFYETFWLYARKSPFYEEILFVMYKNEIFESRYATNLYLMLQNNKKIIFWGASLYLENFLKKYEINKKFYPQIIGIIDTNSTRRGNFLGDYEIFSPDILKDCKVDEVILTVINSLNERYEEVKIYLEEQGLDIKLTRL